MLQIYTELRIRKQYYSRVYPDEDPITDDHTSFSLGVKQVSLPSPACKMAWRRRVTMDGNSRSSDIMDKTDDKTIIIELKDTVAGKRLAIMIYFVPT